MTWRSTTRRSGPTGRVRFAASLGVVASLLVGVTAAVVTDSAAAQFTPIGGKFDVAFVDAAGKPVNDTTYVVPPADVVGAVFPKDSPAVTEHAHFPLRITNLSTGSIPAHASITMTNPTAPGALDVFSKLELRVVNAADGSVLLDWTSASSAPSFAVDVARGGVSTVTVQLRLVERDHLDGRFFGIHTDIGFTLNGESS